MKHGHTPQIDILSSLQTILYKHSFLSFIESQSSPMYNVPWPYFLLVPSTTTFPPSKGSHHRWQNWVTIFNISSSYNVPWRYFLPILYNLPSIKSQSSPMYNPPHSLNPSITIRLSFLRVTVSRTILHLNFVVLLLITRAQDTIFFLQFYFDILIIFRIKEKKIERPSLPPLPWRTSN